MNLKGYSCLVILTPFVEGRECAFFNISTYKICVSTISLLVATWNFCIPFWKMGVVSLWSHDENWYLNKAWQPPHYCRRNCGNLRTLRIFLGVRVQKHSVDGIPKFQTTSQHGWHHLPKHADLVSLEVYGGRGHLFFMFVFGFKCNFSFFFSSQ